MVKFMRFLLYGIVFLCMLMFFFPKENLYYYAEEQLQSYGIVVSGESVEQKPFSLEIENANIYFQKIVVATVKKIDFCLYGLYNHIELEKIVLSSLSSSFVPPYISHVEFIYSVLHPFGITVQAGGDFGSLQGYYDIKTHRVTVQLRASKRMVREYKNTLKMFKKSQNGEYIYEKSL